MDPVADCNLSSFLSTTKSSLDKLSLLRSFFGCLSSAVKYLHESKVRHRDLKPQNILIRGSSVYLTDFGISLDWEHLTRDTTTADVPKTLPYAAPEVIQYKSRNWSSDIWSLGCVFLEMVTVLKGKTVADMRQYFMEQTGDYRMYNNISASEEWSEDLMEIGNEEDNIPFIWTSRMLNEEPSRRPTAALLHSKITGREEWVRFCGPCCQSIGDGEDSVVGAGDPWQDTVIETT